MPILSFWGSVWFGEKPKNQKKPKKPKKTKKTQKKPMPIWQIPKTKKNQKKPMPNLRF